MWGVARKALQAVKSPYYEEAKGFQNGDVGARCPLPVGQLVMSPISSPSPGFPHPLHLIAVRVEKKSEKLNA